MDLITFAKLLNADQRSALDSLIDKGHGVTSARLMGDSAFIAFRHVNDAHAFVARIDASGSIHEV